MTSAPSLDWVIDVDAHVTEPPDLWLERVEARHRDSVPQMRRGEGGTSDYGRSERYSPSRLRSTSRARWVRIFTTAIHFPDGRKIQLWFGDAQGNK